jgi:HSP20 family molecular chaperone IbpA
MSRIGPLNSPLLLGFDEIERQLDRLAKSAGDSYPPYNIERIGLSNRGTDDRDERSVVEILRITLAVAGFSRDQLEVTIEDSQLSIRGRQEDDKSRTYLHRGIAARQFQRTFVLVDGITVKSAALDNGLLSIDLVRPEPERLIRKITIDQRR